MEIVGLNSNFGTTGVVDQFESLIWTDRYDLCGDFELYTPILDSVIAALPTDNFAYLKESEHVMIVETREITTDSEKGNHLKIKGRSLESILERRIVAYAYMLNGNLQTEIQRLLNDKVIATGNIYQTISNFVFLTSTDPSITALTVYAQYEGTTVYDIIQTLCATNGLGFKITLNNLNQFVFTLYRGEDRTYAQTDRNRVIFSPRYDNLVNSDYSESRVGYHNVAYVMGEGTGSARVLHGLGTDTLEMRTGLNRKEIFVNASDLSSQTTPPLTAQQYIDVLNQRGLDILTEAAKTIKFEGEINHGQAFTLGTDFFMGDVVQIENEYGMEGTSRVSEIIFAQDPSKITMIPTFVTL